MSSAGSSVQSSSSNEEDKVEMSSIKNRKENGVNGFQWNSFKRKNCLEEEKPSFLINF